MRIMRCGCNVIFHLMTKKARKSGVMVARTCSFGAILGISKLVFLETGYPEIPYTSLEIEQYDPVTHFSDRIYGRAPWVNGLENLLRESWVLLEQWHVIRVSR